MKAHPDGPQPVFTCALKRGRWLKVAVSTFFGQLFAKRIMTIVLMKRTVVQFPAADLGDDHNDLVIPRRQFRNHGVFVRTEPLISEPQLLEAKVVGRFFMMHESQILGESKSLGFPQFYC